MKACDLYLVGGIVRDILLGRSVETQDADYIAAGVEIDQLVRILNRFGTTNLVGKSFGVIKFKNDKGITVDVSLPRTEYSIGPGHRDFQVTYDPHLPIEKDLERRDYTINSMALHVGDRRLVDPLHGREDLEKRVLRVNNEDSFRDDPLRILRGVQFLARFGLGTERKTVDLMKRDKELLTTVSPERISLELTKLLLLSDRPSEGFLFMHETGILSLVIPELEETYGLEQNEYHPDDLFMHCVKSCDAARPELILRWSALLHDLGKKKMRRVVEKRVCFYRHEEESATIAGGILARLRFPSNVKKKVVHLIRHHMFYITDEWSDGAIRRFIARVGADNLDDLFALREADATSRGNREVEESIKRTRARIEKILKAEAALKRKDLAIDGADVIHLLGIEPGREVGDILQKLLDMVIENPALNTKEKLFDLVKKMKKP